MLEFRRSLMFSLLNLENLFIESKKAATGASIKNMQWKDLNNRGFKMFLPDRMLRNL